MNIFLIQKAAEYIAGEPVSIEPDGTVWADSDGRVIDSAAIFGEVARLEQAAVDEAAAKAAKLESARAKLAALGLDVDEVNAVIGVSA
jgi:hypothetical protein